LKRAAPALLTGVGARTASSAEISRKPSSFSCHVSQAETKSIF
jgi:hypothetical protein